MSYIALAKGGRYQGAEQTGKLLELMHQNADLTQLIKGLSERIETLTGELHTHLIKAAK